MALLSSGKVSVFDDHILVLMVSLYNYKHTKNIGSYHKEEFYPMRIDCEYFRDPLLL